MPMSKARLAPSVAGRSKCFNIRRVRIVIILAPSWPNAGQTDALVETHIFRLFVDETLLLRTTPACRDSLAPKCTHAQNRLTKSMPRAVWLDSSGVVPTAVSCYLLHRSRGLSAEVPARGDGDGLRTVLPSPGTMDKESG